MSSKPNLASKPDIAGGNTGKQKPEARIEVIKQPGRQGTKPITMHMPQNVRDQLKILAIEQGVTMQKLGAEMLNDLFAKYEKPEICPND